LLAIAFDKISRVQILYDRLDITSCGNCHFCRKQYVREQILSKSYEQAVLSFEKQKAEIAFETWIIFKVEKSSQHFNYEICLQLYFLLLAIYFMVM
jgi:hypothetical protein